MINYLETFRKKTYNTSCSDSKKAKLINDSAGSTVVLHLRSGKNITVNLVIKNSNMGKATAKLYTSPEDNVIAGDYIKWNDIIFLVEDEDNNVLLGNKIKKYNIEECNVKMSYGSAAEWRDGISHKIDAVFYGRGSTYARASSSIQQSSAAPLLDISNSSLAVFSNRELERFATCVVNDSQYKVIDWDSNSVPGITFVTLEEVPLTVKEPEIDIPESKYYAGLKYTFATEDYYLTSNDTFDFERNSDNVVITMPYNKNSITFSTKKAGVVVSNTIEIEVNYNDNDSM